MTQQKSVYCRLMRNNKYIILNLFTVGMGTLIAPQQKDPGWNQSAVTVLTQDPMKRQ